MPENKDFDLMVRNMLEGAGEKVSPEVWKAVSSRLGGEPVPVRSGRGMKWWGLLAGAAAAVAALVITLIPRPGITVPAKDSTPIAANAVPDLIPEASGIAPLKEQKHSRTAGRAENILVAQAASPERKAEETRSAEKVRDERAEKPDSSAVPAVPVAPSKAAPAGEPFIDFEEESGRPRIAWALETSGRLSGNETDNGGRRRMSPGTGMPHNGIMETSESVYSLPVSFGIGIRAGLTPSLSIVSGIDWSILTRTFKGTYQGGEYDITHTINYLGVPLQLQYELLKSNSVKFYVFGGGEVSYAVGNKYTLRGTGSTVSVSETVNSLQFGLNAGFGVEFKITDRLGLYLNPGIDYWFYCHQPKSVRTDKPLLPDFNAGLRFNL